MNRIAAPVALGSLLLAAACTSTGPANTSLYWVKPPVGTRIQLNQEITAEGGSRVTLQYGKQVNRKSVTPVDPFCYFFLDRPPQDITKPASISPDTFAVTRVYRQAEYSTLEPIRYAYLGPDLMLAQTFNNGASNAFLSTYMEVSSTDQPQVRRIVCTRWDIPAEQNFLSIDDMRSALGDVARIVLPDGFSSGN